jgi:hypothetical protein
MFKLVAKCGDSKNVNGTWRELVHKEEVLLKHCEAIGRDSRYCRSVRNSQN